jgi:hypothetical protein
MLLLELRQRESGLCGIQMGQLASAAAWRELLAIKQIASRRWLSPKPAFFPQGGERAGRQFKLRSTPTSELRYAVATRTQRPCNDPLS